LQVIVANIRMSALPTATAAGTASASTSRPQRHRGNNVSASKDSLELVVLKVIYFRAKILGHVGRLKYI
jgi:hypothetical protein